MDRHPAAGPSCPPWLTRAEFRRLMVERRASRLAPGGHVPGYGVVDARDIAALKSWCSAHEARGGVYDDCGDDDEPSEYGG